MTGRDIGIVDFSTLPKPFTLTTTVSVLFSPVDDNLIYPDIIRLHLLPSYLVSHNGR